MYSPKPTSRFILFSLLLLLLFTSLPPSISSELDNEDSDDMEALEELIALDEAEDHNTEGLNLEKPSEAQVLTKAQRIVLELNNDNAKRAIDGNEFVLVLGIAPWCVRSAELTPKFAEAATALKELGSPLLLAKLDAERYPKVASNLGIKGFPTLLLFVNGTSQPYTGGFSAEEIVIWARKKTGVAVIRINSDAEASNFLNKHSMFVVGLFEKFEGSDYDEFTKAAKMDNEIQFVETTNAEIAKHLFPDAKQTNLFLGLVKSEPQKYTKYEGTFSTDGILQFLDDNKFPLVRVLTELNAAKVYSNSDKLQVAVRSLTVNNFYVGEGTDFNGVPTKMLTVNGSLRMNVYNPATSYCIHVNSTPINLVYSDITVATGQLKKFYQPRKSRRTVLVNIKATKFPLYGAGSGFVASANGGFQVPLKLEFEIKSRGDVVGKLAITKNKKHISCDLVIDSTSNKPIKFKKDSCVYSRKLYA